MDFFSLSSNAYPLGIEEKINNYSSGATCNSGESFVSCDGVTWDDICDYYDYYGWANVCIKALATSTFTPPPPTPTNNITPIIMLLLGE